MIESMACGTPVIAYRRGSVDEVVEDGVIGFIVDDEQGALQAINRLAATGSAPRPCGIRASVHRAPHGGGLRPDGGAAVSDRLAGARIGEEVLLAAIVDLAPQAGFARRRSAARVIP
jgi:glycosyltransferase involved in cell wall biosynthesis